MALTVLTSIFCPSLGRWCQPTAMLLFSTSVKTRGSSSLKLRVNVMAEPGAALPCLTQYPLGSFFAHSKWVVGASASARRACQKLFPNLPSCQVPPGHGPSPAFLSLLALSALHPHHQFSTREMGMGGGCPPVLGDEEHLLACLKSAQQTQRVPPSLDPHARGAEKANSLLSRRVRGPPPLVRHPRAPRSQHLPRL